MFFHGCLASTSVRDIQSASKRRAVPLSDPVGKRFFKWAFSLQRQTVEQDGRVRRRLMSGPEVTLDADMSRGRCRENVPLQLLSYQPNSIVLFCFIYSYRLNYTCRLINW